MKENEKNQIQKAVENEAIAIGIKTFVDSNKVSKLLNTDKKGVQIVLNNALNEDVKQYGDIDCLSTPHIQKEIALRKEQPRSELEREKLEYASNCLKAFSNNSQLNKERNIENGRIVKERSKIGKKVIKERGSIVSEISGEPLNGDACVHHKNRVADKPEEAFDDDNLTVIKDNEHKEFHSSSYTQDKKGFEEYISKKTNNLLHLLGIDIIFFDCYSLGKYLCLSYNRLHSLYEKLKKSIIFPRIVACMEMKMISLLPIE